MILQPELIYDSQLFTESSESKTRLLLRIFLGRITKILSTTASYKMGWFH